MYAALAQARATGTSNLASTQATFANNTVAGNSVVVVIGSTSTSASVSGVTDAQGNQYTKALAIPNASIGDLEIWYASGIIGGTTDQVTVAYSSNPVDGVVIISEYIGLIYQSTLDKIATNTGNSASPSSGNTSSLTQNVELLIGAVTTTLSNSITVGAGFVNLTAVNGLATIEIAMEDQLVTGGGVQAATFGISSAQWAAGIASFFLLPTGTTTSTSSTSASTFSTSSTSSSVSSTSSSISTTSNSTSTSSTSTSFSSTSSSISSTSSSTSSTSQSSTSSSTSISSTSSSISSTSTSSTSMSSTSSSTSISSTSTSFSSTSSSVSSTSSSVSSTSFSSTSSSSSTSTTLPPPGADYTYQDLAPAFQHIQNSSQLVSAVNTNAIPVAAVKKGDLIVVNAKIVSASDVSPSVTDNASTPNTYLLAVKDTTSGNGNVLYQFYGVAVVGGATTITVTWTGNLTARCSADEFSGNAPTNALVFDKAANNHAGLGTKATTAISPTNAGELIVAAVDINSGTSNATPGDTYTIDNNSISLLNEHKSIGTLSETAPATWAGSSGWEEVVGAYVPLQPKYLNTDLINPFTNPQYDDVNGDDGDYLIQTGSRNVIQQYKQIHQNNTDNINVSWKGRTTLAPSMSPVLLQIYNVSTSTWETIGSQTVIAADTDFTLKASQTANLSNYYDSRNQVSVRVYQLVV